MEDSKIKLLIADDNKALAELMKKYILDHSNFEVLEVTNDGEEELRMIKELQPDVVITDLKRNADTISGIDVIRRCYELGIKKTKFLVQTGVYYESQFNELRKIGITHILRKPFKFEDLIFEIENIEKERQKSLIKMETDIQNKGQTIWNILKDKIMLILKKQKI